MLSVEDQIHRYGDYLEGESLRGVALEVETAEVQSGMSRLAVAALLVLVAGVVAFAAVSLGSREQGEPADTSTAAMSSQEQMALDHSDGIALEVVGDELWILGNGFGNPTVQPPFSIYVTGEQGELLRTIDLGRHFGQMGQSDSYVWLVADGTKSENPPVEPEIMRISKRTGEVERIDWFYPYEPLTTAVYSDDGFWFTRGDGLVLQSWNFETKLFANSLSSDTAVLAVERHDEALIEARGSDLSWVTSGGNQTTVRISTGDSPVVAIESDGEFAWVLRSDGHVSPFDESLTRGNVYQCRGATHLAALPGGGVIASDGFNLCEVNVGGINFRSESEPDQWPVNDTAVFGDRLWYATAYVAEHISEPLPR